MNQLSAAAKSNPTLITGCRLVVPSEGKSLWGDLWMVGESFVFNGVLHEQGAADWDFHPTGLPSPEVGGWKGITLLEGAPYFERRGVVVFEPLHATFNEAARAHIKKMLDAHNPC